MPLVASLVISLAAVAAHAAPHRPGDPGHATPTSTGAGWLSTDANDYNLSLTADGRRLVFGRSPTGDFENAQVLRAT